MSQVECAVKDIRCSRVLVAATARSDLTDKCFINRSIAHSLHHCQMLQVIVRLEQGVASEELDKNTTYAPDVAREAPSKIEYDFWSTVVSSRDNR